MDVILKQDVDRLGAKHDIVNVKNGYARNYLIPTRACCRRDGKCPQGGGRNTAASSPHKAVKALEDAKAIGEKIAGVSLKIGAKAGESGKIFGSVNNIQLADALSKAGHTVDRKNIILGDDVIRDLGAYTAKVKLHKEVIVEISFEVVAE